MPVSDRIFVVRTRWWGAVVTLTMIGAVAWPLAWPLDRDSFPLSNYPMFAWPRLTTRAGLAVVYGVDGTARREPLPAAALGRAPTVSAALDANRQLELLLLGDPDRLPPFCRKIAANVAANPTLRWARQVEIVRDEYDSLRFHAGVGSPAATTTFARCAVTR